MPEIAEVAITAEILKKYLLDKKLLALNYVSGRYIKKDPSGYKKFIKNIPLTVKNIDSKGKFLWFELLDTDNNSWYIWNTFGMSGMWSLKEPPYVRAIFSFGNVITAYYSDSRNFGTFKFSNSKEELDKKLSSLGTDFLKDDFSLKKIKKYKIPIAKLLSDQKKIGSGLGNYLIPEILYRAKISPHRLGTDMSKKDLKKLKYWIKYVVKLAYMDNHIGYMKNLEDETKKLKKHNYHPDIVLDGNTFKFLIYRQKKDPKGNKVKTDKINGERNTYWVPAVQI